MLRNQRMSTQATIKWAWAFRRPAPDICMKLWKVRWKRQEQRWSGAYALAAK